MYYVYTCVCVCVYVLYVENGFRTYVYDVLFQLVDEIYWLIDEI